MRITLVLVGKSTNTHLIALIEDYVRRISFYLPFDISVIPDIKNNKSRSIQEIKKTEGALILQTVPKNVHLVLLDEKGHTYTSVAFAERLKKIQTAHNNIFFVIGGAYGFSQEVYDRADEMLSLSPMTFSHQMVRLLFVEQLYRALTIQNNHPYHHQ